MVCKGLDLYGTKKFSDTRIEKDRRKEEIRVKMVSLD